MPTALVMLRLYTILSDNTNLGADFGALMGCRTGRLGHLIEEMGKHHRGLKRLHQDGSSRMGLLDQPRNGGSRMNDEWDAALGKLAGEWGRVAVFEVALDHRGG